MTTTIETFTAEVGRMAESFGENNTEALEACDKIITTSVKANFLAGETADAEPWPDRKDPGPTHPLLILDGDLMAAATFEGNGAESSITDGKVLERWINPGPTGTSRAGIRRHEFGDEAVLGKEGILARPFFGVSEPAADKCAGAVADHLAEQVLAGL